MTPLTQQAADLFNIHLTPEQADRFDVYARELAAWNVHTNLTAITDPEDVQVRHFLDSLSVVKAVPIRDGMRIMDVGTGAGFPGLPLAIAFPHCDVTLMEATGKKVAFLQHVIAALTLSNVRTLTARAEDAGHLPDQRASYDLVVARAVARLPALLEYLLPLAKLGGRCLAMKGTTAREEADSAKRALAILGGKLRAIERIRLPGVSDDHFLVVIDKIAPTPAPYPRKPGVPTKKPLA